MEICPDEELGPDEQITAYCHRAGGQPMIDLSLMIADKTRKAKHPAETFVSILAKLMKSRRSRNRRLWRE